MKKIMIAPIVTIKSSDINANINIPIKIKTKQNTLIIIKFKGII